MTSTSTAYFLNPTQLAEITNVWHMGEERELEWHCDFSSLTLRLWQHDYTNPRPRAGRVFFGMTYLPSRPFAPANMRWSRKHQHPARLQIHLDRRHVRTRRTFSNLYFIMALNSTNVTVADEVFDVVSVEAFRTPNFIIEAAVSSSAATTLATASSTPSGSLPTATSAAPLGSIEVAPKSSAVQVGVPVGVAAALIFVGVLGWFVWRRRRQKRGEGEGEVTLPLGQDLKGPEMKTGMGGDKVGVAEMGAEGNLFEAPAGDVKRLSELPSYSAPVGLEG